MPLRTVTIVGASGTLGPSVLAALLAAPNLSITVLARASSKSTYPPGTHVTRIADAFPTDELTAAFRGQDAVVVTFAGSGDATEQLRLAEAAAAAGVRRFVPADFGSCDSGSARARELVPLFGEKAKVRERLSLWRREGGAMSWTSVVGGHFFDWGLKVGFLHFDLEKRRALLLDGGTKRWSTSTLARVGEAVVRVLERDAETADRVVFVQSFCVTQGEVLEVLERVSGAKWEVEDVSSEKFIGEWKKKMDGGDSDALGEVVFAQGIVDGDWEQKDDFANELLGLETLDLGKVVSSVFAEGN